MTLSQNCFISRVSDLLFFLSFCLISAEKPFLHTYIIYPKAWHSCLMSIHFHFLLVVISTKHVHNTFALSLEMVPMSHVKPFLYLYYYKQLICSYIPLSALLIIFLFGRLKWPLFLYGIVSQWYLVYGPFIWLCIYCNMIWNDFFIRTYPFGGI